MTEAGLHMEAVADIKKYTWRKVILNAILAPISARRFYRIFRQARQIFFLIDHQFKTIILL